MGGVPASRSDAKVINNLMIIKNHSYLPLMLISYLYNFLNELMLLPLDFLSTPFCYLRTPNADFLFN